MVDINWDEKIDYLQQSRKSWFNSDYLEFLIKYVWRIDQPVKVADFGCGIGFLCSVLLPLLPPGSSYTGYDKGSELIKNAQTLLSQMPYEIRFTQCDLLTVDLHEQFDLVISQTLLMHIPQPERMLHKMILATQKGGLVVCIETNWNVGNAAMYIDGLDVDAYCNLGLLAKLWKTEKAERGTDKCIGMKIPSMMQKAGLMEIGIRMNDCVRFANPDTDKIEYKRQLDTFLADGWGHEMANEDEFIHSLCERGLTEAEARLQYKCEKELNVFVSEQGDKLMVLTIPPMFISYGRKL